MSNLTDIRRDPTDPKMPRAGILPPRVKSIQRPEHQAAIPIAIGLTGTVVGPRGSLMTVQGTDGRRYHGRGPADLRPGDECLFDIVKDPQSALRIVVNVRRAE